jgi:hypothetical protein
MWFYFPSWGEPFVEKNFTQLIIWTINFPWFFVKGLQIVKHINEVVMFFHFYKY